MDERITIRTPDQVELEFELAGIGSRFIALIIDMVVIQLLVLAVFLLLILPGLLRFQLSQYANWGPSFILALVILLIFFIGWGYFLLFETIKDGQTFGKKKVGIRVMRDDGFPIGLKEAALRNLVRVADMLPPPTFLLGGLVMIFNRHGKRLGDMLAGTIVVREKFVALAEGSSGDSLWGAAWVARLERGQSRQTITLPHGALNVSQLNLIEQFIRRRSQLPYEKRSLLAWQIAEPLLSLMGENPEEFKLQPALTSRCETILMDILKIAETSRGARSEERNSPSGSNILPSQEKHWQWVKFNKTVDQLLRKFPNSLRKLSPQELNQLIEDYRRLTCDLARTRSMGSEGPLLDQLNRMAVKGHRLLSRPLKPKTSKGHFYWLGRFPLAVRKHMGSVSLSAIIFLGSALVSYFAVQLHPELGYDLVSDEFLEFEPARQDSLHYIPSLARPIAASSILTNNIQVTLLAFSFGLTGGIGTCLILIYNGLHLGAVAGWMTGLNKSQALWGWVMPHGGTELLAIILSGAAGFILAEALLSPGEERRLTALKRVGVTALTIELGCMVMLVFAGIIEGFVSPSTIGYAERLAVLIITLSIWISYILLPRGT